MDKYLIISESTCDLNQKFVDENNIFILTMSYRICDKEYKNYLDYKEQSLKEFYDLMRSGNTGSTSQLNIIDIQNFWRPLLEDGFDLLVIGFSSGLSGSFNAMRMAKEELQEEFPERKILLLDTLQASGGEGLVIYHAVYNQRNGLSIDENFAKLKEMVPNIITWFTVDDIDTLYRGGRLSGGAAVMAKFLKIKPVLRVDEEGHLKAVYKKIGRKQAIKQLVDSIIKDIDRSCEQTIIIGHADCEDELNVFKEILKEELNKENIKGIIESIAIGPVIGSHSGPGTLMISTLGNKKESA